MFFRFCGFVSALRVYFLLIVRLEATPLWCFFRISFSRKKNARKEKGLTPFSRKGGKPPKRGLAHPRNSPSWVRAPTAKPSECRQDGNAGLASPLGGGGICEANGGEGLWGAGIRLRECLAVSLGLLPFRSTVPPRNKTELCSAFSQHPR